MKCPNGDAFSGGTSACFVRFGLLGYLPEKVKILSWRESLSQSNVLQLKANKNIKNI